MDGPLRMVHAKLFALPLIRRAPDTVGQIPEACLTLLLILDECKGLNGKQRGNASEHFALNFCWDGKGKLSLVCVSALQNRSMLASTPLQSSLS